MTRLLNYLIGLKSLGGGFDLPAKQQRLETLEKESSEPGFWSNQEKARSSAKELDGLQKTLSTWDTLQEHVQEVLELSELLAEDPDSLEQLERDLEGAGRTLDREEFYLTLGGQYDRGDGIISIHAGAGGTEAQDWAEMLLRMYLRWCERRGFQSEILDRTEGETAGVKSVTVEICGDYSYGYLRSEAGTHRLVRISPFDSGNRRHTSFAKVEVVPSLDTDIEIEIKAAELQIDTFRSSGAGGQHMQKNDTACRITHLPSGLVVSCQNERSLTQNKEQAMKVLRGKLHAIEQERIESERARLRGDNVQADFGAQIRSYVLHPYQLVKDLRTSVETGKTGDVLDGDLDRLMEEWLKLQIGLE